MPISPAAAMHSLSVPGLAADDLRTWVAPMLAMVALLAISVLGASLMKAARLFAVLREEALAAGAERPIALALRPAAMPAAWQDSEMPAVWQASQMAAAWQAAPVAACREEWVNRPMRQALRPAPQQTGAMPAAA